MSPPTSDPGLADRVARLERDLQLLKNGVRLLGLCPCGNCGKYFQSSDAKALFDAGELVCRACLPEWWEGIEATMSIADRQALEHKLARWLVANYNAKIIRDAKKLPRAEMVTLKMVVACEQCNGTAKTETGAICRNCEGRGTVWVIELRPEFQ